MSLKSKAVVFHPLDYQKWQDVLRVKLSKGEAANKEDFCKLQLNFK